MDNAAIDIPFSACPTCGINRKSRRAGQCRSCDNIRKGLALRSAQIGIASIPLAHRFWEKVDKSGACWVWNGAVNKTTGYGTIKHCGKRSLTHRIAYEMMRGPIPGGLVVDHLCRNRRCVNPDHMELVTTGENVLRGVGITANNSRKTLCPRGHEYDAVSAGKRRCKACARESARRYLLAHRSEINARKRDRPAA